jgi:hypothetical protein
MQNPKKKKEYVRWADDDELRDFEKVGLNTYLECKKSEQFCHKIKITVEDSE